MSWSYSGNPETSDLDNIRFILGDTKSDKPVFQNEELTYLLSTKPTVVKAAMEACLRAMAIYTREVSYTVGPESVQQGVIYDRFKRLYNQLNSNLFGLGKVDLSTMSPSTAPIFDKGMMDNPKGAR